MRLEEASEPLLQVKQVKELLLLLRKRVENAVFTVEIH